MRRRIFLLILSFMMVVFVGKHDVVGQEGNKENLESNEDTESIGVVNTGVISDSVESIEEQLEGLSEERRELALEKLTYECNDIVEATPRTVTWKYLSGFTMYEQATDYYCLVACCKAAMQHLTGSSDTQFAIAAELK